MVDPSQKDRRWRSLAPWFMALMVVASGLVLVFFGWQSLALGWGIFLLATILLSIEPFIPAALALVALLVAAVILSPQIALGAALLLATALLFATTVLAYRSWDSGRQTRAYRRRR